MPNRENLLTMESKPTERTIKPSKWSDLYIALLFLLILLSVPALYLLLDPTEVSEVEQRWLEQFSRPTKTGLLNKSYQDQLNKALSDQFPGRDQFLMFRAMIIKNMNRIDYALLPDRAIPISDNGNVLLWHSKQGASLIFAPAIYDDTLLTIIDKRVEEYNMLTEAFPNVNFYVFDIELPVTSDHHPVQKEFGNTVGSTYRDYFLLNVDGVHYGKLPIMHEDDILNNFYRSDHHWNIYGAWLSYERLYDMIKLNYPEISLINRNVLFKKVNNINSFRGSFARLAASRAVSDDFYAVSMKNIEPHITLVNGEEIARGLRQIDVQNRHISSSPFANYYGYYFGSDYALVEYIFESNSNRNLLIIGSSYTQAMEYLLASHYSHTHVVDLRHYRKYAGKRFSIVDFINDHNINDVVVIGDFHVCYTQLEWRLMPEKK